MWSCSVCTLKNQPSAIECDGCHVPRSAMAEQQKWWQCEFCCVLNLEGLDDCTVCGTRRSTKLAVTTGTEAHPEKQKEIKGDNLQLKPKETNDSEPKGAESAASGHDREAKVRATGIPQNTEDMWLCQKVNGDSVCNTNNLSDKYRCAQCNAVKPYLPHQLVPVETQMANAVASVKLNSTAEVSEPSGASRSDGDTVWYSEWAGASLASDHSLPKGAEPDLWNYRPGWHPQEARVRTTKRDEEELSFPDQECRLVLVGKTGSGKSSLANTMLGFERFECTHNFNSVTRNCQRQNTERFGIPLEPSSPVFPQHLLQPSSLDAIEMGGLAGWESAAPYIRQQEPTASTSGFDKSVSAVSRMATPLEKLNFPDQECRLLLVGKAGNGKSSLGDTLLGFEHFRCAPNPNKCHHFGTQRFGVHLQVLDTPGLFSTALDNSTISNEITKCLEVLSPGPHAIILVLRIDRFTAEDDIVVKELLKLFSFHMLRFLMIVFTHGDKLKARSEDKKEQELTNLLKLLENAPMELRTLLHQTDHRYVVFDNTADTAAKDRQVQQLLMTIRDLIQMNGGGHFTKDDLKVAELARKEEERERSQMLQHNPVCEEYNELCQESKVTEIAWKEEERERLPALSSHNTSSNQAALMPEKEVALLGRNPLHHSSDNRSQQPVHQALTQEQAQFPGWQHHWRGSVQFPEKRFSELDFPNQECRLLLVGKAGNGKSSLGDTLLGFEHFRCAPNPNKCHHFGTQRFGVHLQVLDTPGLFNTALDNSVIANEISKHLELLSPGPHAIILVLRIDRFTAEDDIVVEELLKLFSFHVLRFLMIVFTHGDKLKARSEDEKEQELTNLLKLLENAPMELSTLLHQIDHRYVVFDNTADTAAKDRQVQQLLVTIKDLIQVNGGGHFTKEDLKVAELAQEEEERERSRMFQHSQLAEEHRRVELCRLLRLQYCRISEEKRVVRDKDTVQNQDQNQDQRCLIM